MVEETQKPTPFGAAEVMDPRGICVMATAELDSLVECDSVDGVVIMKTLTRMEKADLVKKRGRASSQRDETQMASESWPDAELSRWKRRTEISHRDSCGVQGVTVR